MSEIDKVAGIAKLPITLAIPATYPAGAVKRLRQPPSLQTGAEIMALLHAGFGGQNHGDRVAPQSVEEGPGDPGYPGPTRAAVEGGACRTEHRCKPNGVPRIR
ncbi:MAG: hypothetical protein EA402_00945 [Planctomycetota bacterium]|nr:MAG: hypothetical protein EA402_00945 [Planctomycetota bacterium]